MVMHARKQPRLSDGSNDRRDSQSYQTHKSQPKSQSVTLHRHEKMRDGSSDPTPPYKMLRRSDESPVSRHGGDGAGHGKAKTSHTLSRVKDGGTNNSPQENSHNNSSHPSSDSHSNQSKSADRPHEPADDWSEHISSSGKKYYYNCRTEVSQWEKPKDLLEREQRQKDPAKMASNSFPKDRDYRREALQDGAAAKSSSGDKPASHSGLSQSSSSSSAPQSLNPASGPAPSTSSASSSSTAQASPAVQAPPSALQDPALLRQLLPALQATLQMSNGSMDMAKIQEVLAAAVTQASLQSMLHKLLTAGPSAFNMAALLSQAAQHSNQAQPPSQSPLSLSSDATSPRPYVSPRNGTPQTGLLAHKPLHSMTPGSSSQTRANASSAKAGAALSSQPPAEKRPEDPRTMQQRSSPSPGPNHVSGGSGAAGGPPNSSGAGGSSSGQTPGSGSFTPSLAAHFDENLIRHVQGWPAEHMEKQASRLREDAHNMGSLYMSEICTELKNLRSLVRVCEIQATLREQRILFLRQQSKELDKLKNQNSYMV